ncbi:hypothetical protein B484DRAFT_390393 [Ochromonadaceae sp. CCMP2298]|nr:hypothetical protein B484DRAFT_390393 [Ochromonadaceae sp. CCMP2298]
MSNILKSLDKSNKSVKNDISAQRKKSKEQRTDILISSGHKKPRQTFPEEIVSELWEDGNMEIIANAAFSYDCFRIAAARARKMAKFYVPSDAKATLDLTGEQTLLKLKKVLGFTTYHYDVFEQEKKAWNDTVGMCMHAQLQLKPFEERHSPNDKCMMVVDNVGFHHVTEVKAAFAAAGWLLKFFPRNMTDELMNYSLWTWDAVSTLLQVVTTDLATVPFQQSLAKCFVDVGLTPIPDNHFMNYVAKKMGKRLRLS